MNYNLLNYPGNDTTIRNPYFRTVIASTLPDILVVQEMTSLAGVNGFLQKVLLPNDSHYAAGSFIDGPDTDNEIFYKNNLFTFISNYPIQTDLRNISEFKLIENSSGDTIRIYSVHLKANDDATSRLQRKAEVDSLRKRTDVLPPGSYFIVTGDFNLYNSSEPAYLALLNQTNPGYFVDLYNLPGTWNTSTYAQYHTQSTRVRQFGGGSTGGLDDRFDLILMSQSVIDSGGISYVEDSYTNYGNDGNHYNDSINRPPNAAVTQTIANALHYSSDHLPVFAEFKFNPPSPKTITVTALIEGYYNGVTNISDTLLIELHRSNPPYNIVDHTKIFPNSAGEGTGTLTNIQNGTAYYIIVKHRNAVETWSALPQTVIAGTLTYDFTSSSAKAYGNNLKIIGSKWCIYEGDVNQDDVVDASDLNLVYTANVAGVSGYVSTDLNGDMFIEAADIGIIFMNNVFGIERKSP